MASWRSAASSSVTIGILSPKSMLTVVDFPTWRGPYTTIHGNEAAASRITGSTCRFIYIFHAPPFYKILYSKTPCRLGLDEVLNLLIGMDPYDLAKMNMSYRSSIEGTHDLPVQLLKHGMVESLRDDEKVINRNVEVFNAYLKTMGYKLQEAENIQELIFEHIDSDLHERELPNGEKVLVTDDKYIELLIEDKVNKYFEDEIFIS